MNISPKRSAIALRRLTHFTTVHLVAGLVAASLSIAFLGGCAKEESGIVNVCVPPTVIRTSPSDGGANEPLTKAAASFAASAGISGVKVVSATFSTPMRGNTINASSFFMMQGADTIRGTVSYSDTTAFLIVPNGLEPNLTYTCKVTKAVRDLDGIAMVADYVWTFKSIAPGTPTLVSPANGASGLASNPILAWNAVPGAESYRLQVSLSPAFVSTVYDDSTLTGTSRQVTGLAAGTAYFWRLNAKISGTSGAYSDVWKFTTIAPPAAPVLVAPAAGATAQPTTLKMTWLASSGAET